MNRIPVTLAALAAPILAFAHGWEEMPTNVWLDGEVEWVKTFDPSATLPQLESDGELPPPRADWCGPEGTVYTPTVLECDDYDIALEDWMLDYHGTNDVNALPPYHEPPTYCGGC